MHPEITSTSNPIVKQLAKLRKRSERDERGLFLIEGERPVERALQAELPLEHLYYSPDWFTGPLEQRIVEAAREKGVPTTKLSKAALAKAAYREHPEGLLAVAKQWRTKLDDLKLSEASFVIVAEAIEKPGNLGAILRSADATGAEAVIICDSVTDIFNPNVVRASTGVLFSVPTVATSSGEVLTFLKEHGITMFAATPQAKQTYTDADFTQPTAILVGSEQLGLSDTMMKVCDMPVRIPMAGLADSLNVSAATVALAYEVVRQRSV